MEEQKEVKRGSMEEQAARSVLAHNKLPAFVSVVKSMLKVEREGMEKHHLSLHVLQEWIYF